MKGASKLKLNDKKQNTTAKQINQCAGHKTKVEQIQSKTD